MLHRAIHRHGDAVGVLTAGLFMLLLTGLTATVTIRPEYASFDSSTGVVNGNYSLQQTPRFLVDTHGHFRDATSMTSRVLTADGKTANARVSIVAEKGTLDQFKVSIQPNGQLAAGKYRLEVAIKKSGATQTFKQDFTWGVLALNFGRSTYKPNETVTANMAVLDDRGATVCDAAVTLEIVDPKQHTTTLSTADKTIKPSNTCADKNVTNKPDYPATYTPKLEGEYTVRFTARTKNGIRTQWASFVVTDRAAFVSERIETATRLYPASSYDVTLRLHAQRAFNGQFEERVPEVFSITNTKLVLKNKSGSHEVDSSKLRIDVEGNDRLMRWGGLSLKAGEVLELTYTYQPPFISPAFYQLGPMKLSDSHRKTSYKEPRAWQLASDAAGDVIVLWDTASGAVPAGWTCISCTGGDAFYQLFPRANATYAGTGGGPESVTHTYAQTGVSGPSAVASNTSTVLGSRAVGSATHSNHVFPAPTISSVDIKPQYKNLKFIKASNPLSLPANAIAMFDVASTASLPANWTSYTALNDPGSTGTPGNGYYLRGENTNTTGGAATHTHTRGVVTSGTATTVNIATGTAKTISNGDHTHQVAAGSTTAGNNNPSYISVVFAQVSTANEAIPNGMLAFFDNTTLPTGWTQQTTIGGNALANKLIKGTIDSTAAGSSGGVTTHDHGGSQVITSTIPSTTNTGPNSGVTNTTPATNTHTHNVTFSITAGNTMPNYRDVIVGKFATVDITGTVYSDEGSATLGSVAVKGAINGSAYRATTAAANGTYTLAMPDPGPGGVVSVWLDTNGGATGATATRSNGGAISGVDIYQNRLVTTHEDSGPISSINLGSCDKTTGTVCADSDMHFDESSGNLTVDNDWRLYIKAGKTFTPGGTVTLSPGGTAASVGGDLKFGSSASTLNVSTNALNVGGDWINTAGGTLTKSSGQTTTMTGTVTGLTVDASTKNFEKLTFNGSGGAWAFTPAATAVNVDNDFAITTGTVTAPSGTMSVAGSWTNAATFTHNSGTVTLTSTATGKTINPGSSSFNHLTLNGSGGAWSPLTNTVTVAGDLTMTAGTLDNSGGSANVTVNGHVQGTAGVINLSSNTFTQRVATSKNFGATTGSTAWNFSQLIFSNSSGSAVTITTQTGGSGDIVIGSSLLVSNTGDTAGTTLGAGNRTWRLTNANLANPFNLDLAGGTLTGNSSTFEYAGDSDSGNVTIENGGYTNLTLGGSVAENYVSEGALVVGANLLLNTNGTLSGSQNITVSGNVSGAGTINMSSGIFTQRVAAAQNFGATSGSNDWVFQLLRFENSDIADRTVTVNSGGSGAIRANGQFTVGNATDTDITTLDNETNDRTIDANGNFVISSQGSYLTSSSTPMTLGGNYLNSGSFTAGTGEMIFDATTTGKTFTGTMTGANKFYKLTFNGAGGDWSFGSNSAEVNNDFTITAGTVIAPSTTLTLSNNYANSGTFTNNSGLVVFNATTTGRTINPGTGSPFHNVTFNGSGGGWTTQTNAAVINNDLLMVAGTLNSSVNVTVGGNVQCSVTCGTISIGSGTFTQSVTASKSFGTNVAVGTVWSFNNLTLHASAGTPTITFNATGTGSTNVAGTLTVSAATSSTVDDATNNRIIDVNGDVSISAGATFQAPPSASFTVNGSWANAGTFTHSSGAVVFDAGSSGKTIDAGSSSFNNLTFDGTGGAWSPLTNTLGVAGNLTMTNGTLDNSNGSADVTVNGHVQGTAGVINLSSNTFTQRVATGKNFGATSGSSAWNFSNLIFSNSSGSSATITTQTGGSGNIVVAGALTVSNTGDTAATVLDAGNRTWKLTNANQANPFNLDLAGGVLTGSSSTFEYTGDNDSGDVTVEDATYFNLTFGGAVAENYTPEGTTTISGNLLINANATLTGTQNVTVNGNANGAGAVSLSTPSIFTQRVAAAQNFGTTSGSNEWVFNQLKFENSSASDRTVTINGTGSGAIRTNGLLTIGGASDTNVSTLDDETNDRVLDTTTFFVRTTGGYLASSTTPLTVGGSYTNNGTLAAGTGEVIFDGSSAGNTIAAGGTAASKQFYKVTFNNGSGGWTIQTNDMKVVSDLSITDINTLTLSSGRTLEVDGVYSVCNTCTSKTTWTGGTLYLNSGTAYTVGSKTQDAETYGTLQVGANTDIRTWRSSATTATVDSSGSLYSQDHAAVTGALNIYGDYHVTGTDYWSYSTDFDGTALVGAAQRQAVVRIETGSGRGVTVDSTKTLNVRGGGAGTLQFSDIDRIGGSGQYHLVNSGTARVQEAKVFNASCDGGTWPVFNTVVSGQTVTSGTLTLDWYLAPQVADRDTLAAINTAGADATISETSGSPASTVSKLSSGIWGSGATSQTADTGSDGRIAQPNTDNALRVREYSQTSGGSTYYQYNLSVAAQSTYATYDYKRDYGKYITSTGNTGSSEDQVIGAAWYRDTIGTENTAPAINGSVTGGTWYVGMSTGMLALWDTADGSAPSGWSCVSCSGGDPFYQRFLRGAASYGGTGGGSETHGHNLSSPSAGAGGTFSALTGVTNVASDGHTHTWGFGAGDDTTTGDNKPPYKNIQIIRGPTSGPLAWPANLIMPFKTATAPTNWTAYTALDGSYARGENTNTTGGSATHGHNSSPLTSGAASGTVGITCTTGCVSAASTSHTHTLAATALTTANNDPLHINVRFMKHSDTSAPPNQHMLALFDHTSLPTFYVLASDAAPYQNNLLVGATSGIESTGGSATHDHGGSLLVTSSTPVEAAGSATTGSASAATGSHTHDVTYTVDAASSMPLYRDVVIAKYIPNLDPNTPSSLAQKTTSDVVITSGGWTSATSVKFTAVASDPDTTSQDLQLCVEKKDTGTSFTGTEDLCGTAVTESGTGTVNLSVTITGLSPDEYHWQARVKDQDGAYSSWLYYDTSDINTRDFGIDTSAPTTASVYDNTNLDSQPLNTDSDQNADGLLTTLSATWGDFDASTSGLAKYEYSIGTSAGATDIKAWTDNGTTRYKRDSSLSLQTNKTYYFNVRATDNAGNVSSVVSSNGQIVTPTLTFDIDVDASDIDTSPPYAVDFGSLTAASVANSPKKIWVDFDTNGVAGGRVYVAGLSSGLHSTAANFTISSATSNLGTAPSGFGAQGSTASQTSGGPFTISSPYDGSSDNVGALNTTFQSIFSTSNPVTAARGSFLLKVKPSNLTPASNDYSETLIIIAAGTY